MRFLQTTFATALIATIALTVGSPNTAQGEFVTDFIVANQWGEIREDGVRQPLAGHRFLNASGTTDPEAETRADAFFRFDVLTLKGDLNNQYGVGNWSISDVNIALTQQNFGGSTAGGVRLYHVADDLVAITSGLEGDGAGDDFSGLSPSPLVYGDWQTLPLGNSGNPVLTYTFDPTGTGDVDVYGVADGLDISSMASWLDTNSMLTFVAVADDDTVATYKGNEFQGRLPPQLRITAVPEPTTAGLFALLSGAYAVRRRRVR